MSEGDVEYATVDEWTDGREGRSGTRFRVTADAELLEGSLEFERRRGVWQAVAGVHPAVARRLASLLEERRSYELGMLPHNSPAEPSEEGA